MRHFSFCAIARALAAAGMLSGSTFAANDIEPAGAAIRPADLEQRVTDAEYELNRMRAVLDQQQSIIRRYEAQANQGTAASPVALGSATKANDAAAAHADNATLSKGYVVGSDMNFKAKWNNGLNFETAEKDFTMHIGGRFHYDWVWFDPDPSLELPTGQGGFGPWQDGCFIRRVRFQMDGKMWSTLDYNVELDFAGTDQTTTQDSFNRASVGREVILQDVWVQASELPVVGHLRMGHIKQVMGLENYQSSKYLTFMERGDLQDAFLQEYDPGFLLWNNALTDTAWWGTGFYRIDAEDTGIDFGDGEYAWTSRVCYLLWDNPDHRYLMHVGGSYSLRNSEFDPTTGRDIVRFRSRPELRQTPRLVDTNAIACDDANLFGAEAAYVRGPLSIQAEYILTHIDNGTLVPANNNLGDVDLKGWYAFVSYFLTGEHRPYDTGTAAFGRVKPLENFWLVRTAEGNCFGYGAWEVAARYSSVDLDQALGGTLNEVTLGLNWYWNPNVRMMFNYLWADRDINLPQQSGEVKMFGMRISLDF